MVALDVCAKPAALAEAAGPAAVGDGRSRPCRKSGTRGSLADGAKPFGG